MASLQTIPLTRTLKPSSLIFRLPFALRASHSASFLIPAPAISLWRPLPSTLSLPALTIPTFASLGSIFGALWDGILLAVPKKRPSKSQSKIRRNSQGKSYKDVENLVSCSSCGRIKRMHVLCPYCVQSEYDTWKFPLPEKQLTARRYARPLSKQIIQSL